MKTVTAERSSEHPFDDPYGVMQYLEAHIASLQAAMQSEQDARAREVCQLQGDIRALQEAFAAEQARACYDTLAQALANEWALREGAVQQLSGDLQGLSGRVTDIHKQLGVHDEEVAKLAVGLRSEMHERVHLDRALNTVCCAEARERKAQYEQLTKDLEELTWRTEAEAAFTKEALQRLAEVGMPPPPSTADWPPNSAYQRGRFSHAARGAQPVGLTLAKSGMESSATDNTAASTAPPPTVTPSSARGPRPYTAPLSQDAGLRLPPWQAKRNATLPLSFVT